MIFYGTSDDILSIESISLHEETEADDGILYFSNGQEVRFKYDGTWKFIPIGDNFTGKIIRNIGDDNSHEEPFENYTSYSDILIMEDKGIKWVKVNRKNEKKIMWKI